MAADMDRINTKLGFPGMWVDYYPASGQNAHVEWCLISHTHTASLSACSLLNAHVEWCLISHTHTASLSACSLFLVWTLP